MQSAAAVGSSADSEALPDLAQAATRAVEESWRNISGSFSSVELLSGDGLQGAKSGARKYWSVGERRGDIWHDSTSAIDTRIRDQTSESDNSRSAQDTGVRAGQTNGRAATARTAPDEVSVGLGRIVALYERSSTLYQADSLTFGTSFSEATMRPNPRSAQPSRRRCDAPTWRASWGSSAIQPQTSRSSALSGRPRASGRRSYDVSSPTCPSHHLAAPTPSPACLPTLTLVGDFHTSCTISHLSVGS